MLQTKDSNQLLSPFSFQFPPSQPTLKEKRNQKQVYYFHGTLRHRLDKKIKSQDMNSFTERETTKRRYGLTKILEPCYLTSMKELHIFQNL